MRLKLENSAEDKFHIGMEHKGCCVTFLEIFQRMYSNAGLFLNVLYCPNKAFCLSGMCKI